MNRIPTRLHAFGAKVAALAGLAAAPLVPAPAAPGQQTPAFREIPTGVERGNFAGVVMGDLDGDGRAELLSGLRDSQQGLSLLSFKNGTWERRELTENGEYGGLALADITGDRVPDVVAVKTTGRSKGLELFRTIRGKDGASLTFESIPSPWTESACDDLAVGDIESDGDLDLAVSTGGQGLQVLVNDGSGERFRRITLETGNYEDTGIAFGDADGNGRLDVIAANHPGKNPRLFLCQASGEVAFDAGHTEGLEAPGIGFRMAVADFDGDGHADLALGTAQGVRLFIGNGCQGDAPSWWTPAPRPCRESQTMQVSTGDLNRDGHPDLACSSDSGIVLVLNDGAGRFSARLDAGLPSEGEFSGCTLHDWDGDGDLDLACSSLQGNGIRFFENVTAP